jgi:hypothetical protein
MFRTQPISYINAAPKLLKLDNVLVNVVAIVTSHNQQPKQQVLKERELIKAKGEKD